MMHFTYLNELRNANGRVDALQFSCEKDGTAYPILITRRLPQNKKEKGWWELHPDYNADMEAIFRQLFKDELVFADSFSQTEEFASAAAAAWDSMP